MTVHATAERPARDSDASVRILATNDVLGTVSPMGTSYGLGGSISGVEQMLREEGGAGTALWLDGGDLTAGPEVRRLAEAPWDPWERASVSAAVAGNHEFDEGVPRLLEAAARLPFPLLCADRDIGLPAATLIETPGGSVGVVGITHPQTHLLAPGAPPRRPDWRSAVNREADRLRAQGAEWVVGLCHDGVTWWRHRHTAGSRSDRLAAALAGVAQSFDVILGGHTLNAWVGELHGVPAGHAHPFASSVLFVDLHRHAKPTIHPPVRVDLVPQTPLPATPVSAGREEALGYLSAGWSSVPSGSHYLPDLVAMAYLGGVTDADGAFVAACDLFTQGPLDGVVASLGPGSVTDRDIARLSPYGGSLQLLQLHADEFCELVRRHDRDADPRNECGDSLWWNWARAPAGTAASPGTTKPRSVAVTPFVHRLAEMWLGRRLTTKDTRLTTSYCLRRHLSR